MKIAICTVAVILAVVPHDHLLAQSSSELVSDDDIVKSLDPPRTRSLGGNRGFGAQAKKKVDLNVPFEYNSSHLAPEAVLQLEQLGNALLRDELSDFRFEIVGHTDSSGSADYNRSLSERRAESVRAFLIDKGVAADRLDWTGYGEDEPLLPDDPGNPSNRRVEIRNLGESSQ